MENIIQVSYGQTGQSTISNTMGMREMQQKAYQARLSQLLLIKAPPASGKSRALMFIALDKLINQGIEKVIVAVPERSIGSSFAHTDLVSHGFFANWEPNDQYNLCTPGGDNSKSKVDAFINFMHSDEKILICTHATLRFAYEQLHDDDFNNCLLAIDEFHHVSASEENILGSLLRSLIRNSTAHIVAMTGSYFRGDSLPVLMPEDEEKFTKVTYNYYQQLNGYKHLKSLGIGYHFYQGRYYTAIDEVLDTDKKTILHIPNVNANESTKEKYEEVDRIIDLIGSVVSIDEVTAVMTVKRHTDGKLIKVADLVNDDSKHREKIVAYLRSIKQKEDMDLIIALGMAKEGFDWPYCEHALTVGYRGSLTEIIQIIGRTTRDSEDKSHAQFTNLLAKPDAQDDNVVVAVNNMLKAITASLLMEQVLAPNFDFKPKRDERDLAEPGTIKIKGFKGITTPKVKSIVEEDINDLKAAILQDKDISKAITGSIDPEIINKVLIPKVIKTRYPELDVEELEAVRQYVVSDSVVKSGELQEVGDKKFIVLSNQFINIDEISIDLIDSINPFQRAYEILSKSVTAPVLKAIQDVLLASKIKISEEEALLTWPKIVAFVDENKREPSVDAINPLEVRLAEVLVYIRDKKRKAMQNG
ncbi:DEAD/DEAH box helicase [Myroides marinus]|uniref:DEAD/DEAH box helicase n=1 Tax=Myroides marinus TaxID=703342 RepID=UPI0025766FE3|nr:DEAD/DEAH box helicase [Myroides marinus]MDM1378651.1 DEAD/DEAH box helicase family protein [Myroides marinus]MDM1385922.1 DEAD/DEAH box helicase family protein [Myroides marinus]MDM1393135.1 DEAD/DEAH box helicase family protein [Myroides marinus]